MSSGRGDVTLCCRDGRFVTFRLVLAAASTFWRNALETVVNGSDATVIVPDVSVRVFEQMHEMILSSDPQLQSQIVPDEMVVSIFKYCCKYCWCVHYKPST